MRKTRISRAQFAEVLDEVVGEGVVIIYEDEHKRSFRVASLERLNTKRLNTKVTKYTKGKKRKQKPDFSFRLCDDEIAKPAAAIEKAQLCMALSIGLGGFDGT